MIQIVMRVIVIWGIDDSCKQGAFRQVQLADGFAEILFGSLLYASDIAYTSKVHLVHIHFEDLLLGDLFFQLHSKINLLNLVFDVTRFGNTGIVILEVCQFDQLHRECGTTGYIPCDDCIDHGFDKTWNIETVMCEVTGIFDRQECIDQCFRYLIICDVFSQLCTDVCDLVSIFVKYKSGLICFKICQIKGRFILKKGINGHDADCSKDKFKADKDCHDQCQKPESMKLLSGSRWDDLFLSACFPVFVHFVSSVLKYSSLIILR